MTQKQFCQSCNQKHQCRQVYEKLGNTQGSPVIRKVLLALLLPMMSFIAALTAFELVLTKTINAEQLRTSISFLLAMAITSLVVLAAKILDRHFDKTRIL